MFLLLFFFAYQALQIISLPAVSLYMLMRLLKKKPFGPWRERLGFVPSPRSKSPVLWLHAVSVGEVLSIENFIKQCKRENPTMICYLTCGTIGGMQVAKKLPADHVSFMPFDFLVPMILAFKRIRPIALVIIEAEIWPNLLMLAHFKKIPLYLLNGRINPTSAQKRRFIGFLYRLFTHVFAQHQDAVEQFTKLGLPQHKISILGDIKAWNVSEKKQALLAQESHKANIAPHPYIIVLAGSLHAGELDVYLNTYQNLKKHTPTLRLILVPRHFHWQQELIEKITGRGLPFTLWTTATPTPTSLNDLGCSLNSLFSQTDILVICKLGMLFFLYPFADVYCLGGTFVPVGGHNLLEPAVWGNPCIIGPHYHMCRDIAESLHAAGGLLKAATAQELQNHLQHLITHSPLREEMGNKNKTWLTLQAETTGAKIHDFIKKLCKATPF